MGLPDTLIRARIADVEAPKLRDVSKALDHIRSGAGYSGRTYYAVRNQGRAPGCLDPALHLDRAGVFTLRQLRSVR